MEEIWKDIKGYEGLYQVSNLGRVKSLKNSSGKSRERIKTLRVSNRGYYLVNLCKNRYYETKSVHRLVAEAFIPNPENLPVINHKDENQLNNNFDNLEWCSQKYNLNYSAKRKKEREKINEETL